LGAKLTETNLTFALVFDYGNDSQLLSTSKRQDLLRGPVILRIVSTIKKPCLYGKIRIVIGLFLSLLPLTSEKEILVKVLKGSEKFP
jgi:hypothetical protein